MYLNLNLKLFVLVLFLLATGCLALSCRKKPAAGEEYLIKTDSIVVPDTVRLNQSFQLAFYGTIGENGCYRFSRFHIEKNQNKIQIQVIGEVKTGENLNCPQNLPDLNGQALLLQADSLGLLKLEVLNPGLNQLIRKTIMVIP